MTRPTGYVIWSIADARQGSEPVYVARGRAPTPQSRRAARSAEQHGMRRHLAGIERPRPAGFRCYRSCWIDLGRLSRQMPSAPRKARSTPRADPSDRRRSKATALLALLAAGALLACFSGLGLPVASASAKQLSYAAQSNGYCPCAPDGSACFSARGVPPVRRPRRRVSPRPRRRRRRARRRPPSWDCNKSAPMRLAPYPSM
jgi:hypothetical protein